MSLINPGDEVIALPQYWVSYREIIKLAQGKAVLVPAGIDKDFEALAADIEPHLNERTRMFLFSSPNNPTGAGVHQRRTGRPGRIICALS